MKLNLAVLRLPAAVSIAVLLAACGGGGGSNAGATLTPNPTPTPTPGPTPTPTPTPTGCTTFQIVGDTTVAAGKVAGASALSCSGPLRSVVWSQLEGPLVEMAAAETPTVAFETEGKVGTVQLKVDAVLADGSKASATTSILVGPAPAASYLTLRNDHSVRPGMSTSIRAWPKLADGETVASITWTQVDGPAAKDIDTTDKALLTFTAPMLGTGVADVALKFRATLTTSGGKTDTDDVIVSLDRQAPVPANAIFDATARVHAYDKNGKYASVLARCAYDASLYFTSSSSQNLCPVSTLPLLSTEAGGGEPSIDQIMSRVLVSHDFLAVNFRNFLETQDPYGDFRKLLGGVTAVVIGSHVRPSFYYPVTGAIYLDANNLWLTPTQRDVVTEVPDYRSGFDDQLSFTGLGRVVKGGTYAIDSYANDVRVTRPASQLQFVLGRLMYHELAHASDFFSPADRNLNGAASMWVNLYPRYEAKQLPSDALATSYPLLSPQMKSLGQVMYKGKTASVDDRSYSAAQVGAFFASDVASDDYAYSINIDPQTQVAESSREDLAMLFEEFMMAYRHNAQYDVAYTNVYRAGMSADDLLVGWGQRGRIGDALIKPRVKLVIARIAPWIAASAVDALPAPVQMRVGASWTSNLNPGSGLINERPRPASFYAASKVERAREDVLSRRKQH